MKSDFLDLPARRAPCGVEIDDDGLFQVLSLLMSNNDQTKIEFEESSGSVFSEI